MSSRNNKGQITLFIIIGMLLLLGVAIYYYLNQVSYQKEAAIDISKIETSSQLDKAVANYVDTCLKPIVLNGIEIIRLQGGYIDIPSGTETETIKDPNGEYVSLSGASKKVVIDTTKSGNKVPFWVKKEGYTMPSLRLIKSQLENYTTRELKLCINDFEPFKQQGYEVSQGSITTTITFGDSVVADINFPVSFKKNDIQTDTNKYTFSVPINIPLVHDIALTLALSEYSLAYLEFTTNNLWGLYSGVKSDLLPPFREERVNMDGSFVTWDKNTVKSFFKNVIAANMNNVEITGTDYPAKSGIYKSFEYDLLNQSYPNIVVDHYYLIDWPIYNFAITPDPIKPSMFEEFDIPFIPSFYMFKYKFYYSAEYPVLIEVKDKESAKIYPHIGLFTENEGYKIQFLDYAAIYGNQARKFVANPFAASAGEDAYANAGIDTNAMKEAGINVLPESYFCNEDQKLSGNITIKVSDSRTKSAAENVNLLYECGSSKNSCFIGTTGEDGSLTVKMPLCQNGQLRLSKQDYETKKETLTISEKDKSMTLNYGLSPYVRLNATVMKYKMTQPNKLGNLMNLENDDQVILTIKKKGGSDISTSDSQTVIIGKDLQQNEIKLIPNQYEITGMFMTKGFTISKNCERICTDKNEDNECTTYTYLPQDDISFGSTTSLGGVNIGASNSYWDVTDNMLNSNKITFYVIQEVTPNCLSNATGEGEECLIAAGCISTDEVSKTEEYSTKFRDKLTPRFG